MVGAGRHEILDEIGILAVVVLRVCRLVTSATLDAHHKPVLAKHLRECVTPREATCVIEHLLQDGMQFRCSQTRIGLAILTGLLHDDGLYGILCKTIFVISLVICLSAVTKQPAKRAQGRP